MLYNARVESVFISNVESVPNSNVELTCIVKIKSTGKSSVESNDIP